MVKLKLLTMHKLENVPDHLVQEMQDFALKLTLGVKMYVETVQPNIAMAGLNWMMACMLKYIVTENPEELRKAAEMSCSMLLKNMEILIKQMEEENQK